jgi:hypothetical protein
MSLYKLVMPYFKVAMSFSKSANPEQELIMSHSRIASPKSNSQIKYFYRIAPHYDPNRKKIC